MSNATGKLILGIDPGSRMTGYGLLRQQGGQIAYVAHGTIVLNHTKTIAERLGELAIDLSQIIDRYRPHHAVVEDVFLFKNPRAALILGQARGAILAILGLRGISIESLSPTKAKSLVSGRGRAQKFQIATMVASELRISTSGSKDASDALALALAYAHMLNSRLASNAERNC